MCRGGLSSRGRWVAMAEASGGPGSPALFPGGAHRRGGGAGDVRGSGWVAERISAPHQGPQDPLVPEGQASSRSRSVHLLSTLPSWPLRSRLVIPVPTQRSSPPTVLPAYGPRVGSRDSCWRCAGRLTYQSHLLVTEQQDKDRDLSPRGGVARGPRKRGHPPWTV